MRKISIACAMVLMALSVSSCDGNRKGGTAHSAPSVRTVTVDSASLSVIPAEFTGTADDSHAMFLSFPVSGNVAKIYVREGQRVSSGELVAMLDTRTAENALSAARASYERAEDGYRRAKEVYDKGSMPEVKWIEITSQRDQAAALYDIAVKNLEDCSLYSPAGGVVSSVNVEPGMNIPAYRPVVGLTDPSSVEVGIRVPEGEISSLSIGDEATVAVPALGRTGIPARIVSKGVTADPVARSYEVRLSVPEGSGIMPGMTCRVMLSGSPDAERAFVVPGKSVSISNDGRRYVWTVSAGRAHRKYVEVAGAVPSGVLVTSGLDAGDAVVVEGMTKISEGMAVTEEE